MAFETRKFIHVAPNTFGAQYYKVLKRKSQIWLWRSTNLFHIVNYSVKGGGEEGDLPNVGKLRRLKTVLFFLKDKSQSKDKAFGLNVNSNDRATSKRRIFEKGGVGNLRIIQTKRKRSSLGISPFSCPKLGEDQKKKDLHSDLVRFLAKKKVFS